MQLLRLLSSDWSKTKRTAVRTVTFAALLLFPLALLVYYSGSARTADLPGRIHEAYYQAGCILLPVAAGLLGGLLAAQEEQAGHFNGWLGQAAPRAQIYLSKLLLLLCLMAVILFGSLLVLLLGMKLVLQLDQIGTGAFILSGALALAGSLVLGSLHIYLAFAYGLGASVGAGGAGFLVAAIIGTTSIGDKIWPYIPWAWPSRLAWLPSVRMAGSLPDGLPENWLLRYSLQGLIPAAGLFLLATLCSILWFSRWEGRVSYE